MRPASGELFPIPFASGSLRRPPVQPELREESAESRPASPKLSEGLKSALREGKTPRGPSIPGGDSGALAWKTLLYALLVLVSGGACLFFIKRIKPRLVGAKGKGIAILQTTSLGPRQRVAVLEIEGEDSFSDAARRTSRCSPNWTTPPGPLQKRRSTSRKYWTRGWMMRTSLRGSAGALLLLLAILMGSGSAAAQEMKPEEKQASGEMPSIEDMFSLVDKATGESENPETDEKGWTAPIRLAVVFTLLALLPSLLVMVTSFTRIVIVLSFVRRRCPRREFPRPWPLSDWRCF